MYIPKAKRRVVPLLWLSLGAVLVVLFLPGAQACDDYDRDNVGNSEDNCKWFYNPAQLDGDQDGDGDACDEETPLYGLLFSTCYRSTLIPTFGESYKDIPTVLTGDDDLEVMMDMPASLYNRRLIGPAPNNERDIWMMAEDKTWMDYYAVFTEGSSAQVDEDGEVTRFEGVYHMLFCPGCFGNPDADFDYVYWQSMNQGTWVAEKMPPEYCGLEPVDDDTQDDDTADDDSVDNDGDDDTDDLPSDDDVPSDDDDDDDGCGC